ncbi:HORMA domain-containing protein 2-like, partial [Sceloporus undulatus]|uniref:HORMA domain-containing protein 2-like n=1 Tax=Sceloporus undulatus TaxID=8520 RepID=UPI001C4D9F81
MTELYRFKFKYSNAGPQMDFVSTQGSIENGGGGEEARNAGLLLIRKLYVLMQNLGPLPNDITLTMKLFYYNDVTPSDYQPPGFKDGEGSNSLLFDGDPVNLRVGSLSTAFHVLKVRITTDSQRVAALHGGSGGVVVEEHGGGPMQISHQGLDCDEEEEEDPKKQQQV